MPDPAALAPILVVDDDTGLLRLMERTLKREGFATATASSGKDAIAWLARNTAALMLLDLKLPDIEGKELINHLTDGGRPVPFVIITGQGDERVAVDMMKRGALDYLVKDVNFTEFLLPVVRRALEQIDKARRLSVAELHDRLQYVTTRALAGSGTLADAVPNVLGAVCDIMNWDQGEFWKPRPKGDELECVEIRSRLPHTAPESAAEFCRPTAAAVAVLVAQVCASRRPIWTAVPSLGTCAFAFPILLRHEVLGVLAFFARQIPKPESALAQVFLAIGHQVGQFIERKRLEQALLDLTEREQRKFGQDLHDGLGQRLTALEMLSNVLAEDLKAHSADLTRQARRLNKELRETVTQARLISHSLAPVPLGGDGLMQGLAELAAGTSRIPGVKCRLLCDPPVHIADQAVATHLYRIAQEAVNNALKHGPAKRIEIALRERQDGLEMSVKNDGSAMPAANQKSGGMGLNVMRYRAGIIGASLSIESDKGKGVRVICTVRRKA